MSKICSCPPGTAIVDIPLSDCSKRVGQIQKVLLQRKYSTGTTRNSFTIATANPNVLASWTPLLAAADGTKVVQTPYLNNPVTEEGSVREFGGGNATVGGIPTFLGRNPTPFTTEIHDTPQNAIEALKQYECELIQMYLINEDGKIWGITDDFTTPTTFTGIPVSNKTFKVSDNVIVGWESSDMNMLRWLFDANWSDYLYDVTPTDFDAKEDLVTP